MVQKAERYVTELDVDSKKGDAAIRAHGEELDRAARRAQKASEQSNRFGKNTERASAPLREQERLLKRTTDRLERFTRAHDPAARTAKKLADAERLINEARRRGIPVTNQTIAAQENLRRQYERQVRAANDNRRAANDNARAQGHLSKSFTGTQAAAASLLLVYIKLAAVMGAAAGLRGFATFEERLSTVRAVTQATDTQMQDMETAARRLGATTKFSATQAADGMVFLGRAGFTTSQIIQALPGTLALAAAGALELGDAADIASNVLTGFQMDAREMGRVADVLAAAAANANTDILQLGQGMKFVAPVAASLDVSLESTTAAIGALSDAGLQGEMAGTGLRGALLSLLSPTNEGKKALASLGLTVEDVNPKTHGLADILGRLAAAGLGAGEAVEIAGKRGGTALLVLSQSADKVRTLTQSLEEADGAAARMAQTMSANLFGAGRRLLSVLNELTIMFIGDGGIGGALTRFLDRISNGLLVFTQFRSELGANRDEAEETARSLRALGAVVAALGTTFAVAKAAAIAFALATSFTPWGLALRAVIATIAVAAAKIGYLWEETVKVGETSATVGEVVKAAWTKVSDTAAWAVERVGALVSALAGLGADAGAAIGRVVDKIGMMADALVERFRYAVAYVTSIPDQISAAFAALSIDFSFDKDALLEGENPFTLDITFNEEAFAASRRKIEADIEAFAQGPAKAAEKSAGAVVEQSGTGFLEAGKTLGNRLLSGLEQTIQVERMKTLGDTLSARLSAAVKKMGEAGITAGGAGASTPSAEDIPLAQGVKHVTKAIDDLEAGAARAQGRLEAFQKGGAAGLEVFDRQAKAIGLAKKAVEAYASANEGLVTTEEERKALYDKLLPSAQRQIDLEHELAEATDGAVKAAQGRNRALADDIEAMRLQNEIKQLGTITTVEEATRVVDLRKQIALLAIDREIDAAVQRQTVETNKAVQTAIGREIDLLKQRRGAVEESFAIDRVEAFKSANEKAAKATEDRWSESIGVIEGGFSDLMDGLFDKFGKLGSTLKAFASDLLRQFTGTSNGAAGGSTSLIGGLIRSLTGGGTAGGGSGAGGSGGGLFGNIGQSILGQAISKTFGSFMPNMSSILQFASPLTNAIGLTTTVAPTLTAGATAGSVAIGGYGGTAIGGAAGAGSGLTAGPLASLSAAAPYLAAAAAIAMIAFQSGMFGAGPTSGPVGIADFSPGLGRERAFDVDGIDPFTADNGGNAESMRPIAEAIADLIADNADRFGATIDTSLRFRVANYAGPEAGNSHARVQGFEVNAFIRGEAERRIAEGLDQTQAIFEAFNFAVREAFTFESRTLQEIARNSAATTTEELLADLEFGRHFDLLREEIARNGGRIDQNTLAQAENTLAIRAQAEERAAAAVAPILDALKRAVSLFPAVDGSATAAGAGAGQARPPIDPLAHDGPALAYDRGALRGEAGYTFRRHGDEYGDLGTLGTPAGEFTVRQTGSDEYGDNFAVMDAAGEVIDTYRSLNALLAAADDIAAGYTATLAVQNAVVGRTAEEQSRYDENLSRVGFAVDVARQQVHTLVDTITGEFEPAIQGPFATALAAGRAELDALREHMEEVNEQITAANENFPELGQAVLDVNQIITDASATILANARSEFEDSLQARSNAATGLGIINQIDALLSQRDIDGAEAAAVGSDLGRVGTVYDQELRALLSSTSLATLGTLLTNGQITDAHTRGVIELRLQEEALAVARAQQAVSVADLRTEYDTLASASEKAARTVLTLRQAAQNFYVDETLSPLSSLGQVEKARADLEAAFALANDDTPDDLASQDAISRLPGLSRTLLELSRGYYASTEGYLKDFNRAQQILNTTASAQEAIERTMLTRMTEIRDLLRDNPANDNLSAADQAAAGGFSFGANVAANKQIYNALVAAGLNTPSGFGSGQLTALRQNDPAVDAVVKALGYADGGLVTGGVPGRDSVLAALTPGERVLTVEQNRTFETMTASMGNMERMSATMSAILDALQALREQANQNAQHIAAVVAEGSERVRESVQENTAAVRAQSKQRQRREAAKRAAA